MNKRYFLFFIILSIVFVGYVRDHSASVFNPSELIMGIGGYIIGGLFGAFDAIFSTIGWLLLAFFTVKVLYYFIVADPNKYVAVFDLVIISVAYGAQHALINSPTNAY